MSPRAPIVLSLALASAGAACGTTRVVAPTLGVRVAITHHHSTASPAHLETSVALLAGASPRPPLAPAITQPVAKRREAHRPAPCRVESLCAWEREAAAVAAQVLAHESAMPDIPITLDPSRLP